MNTRQLVSIWYAGIAGITIIVTYVIDDGFFDSLLYLLLAIVIFGALLVLTFRDRNTVNLKSILLSVLIPILTVSLVVGIINYSIYLKNRPAPILNVPSEQIEVFDAFLQFQNYYARYERKIPAIIVGRITNSSTTFLRKIKIRIKLADKESKKIVDGAEIEIEFGESLGVGGIPPSETRSFEAYVPEMRLPKSWVWSYDILSAQGN